MKSSRRTFLQSALATPLIVRLGGGRMEALVAMPPQVVFDNPHILRYDASCFTINEKDTMIASGAFHYPRCPKTLWRDRLWKFKAAGLNTIETYVFWNYHEPEKGKLDLSEFEDFIKLVHDMGFYMIVRPGPYVCAEWERGGIPDWVAAMRFPLRTNHPKSIETSRHWYDAVLPVIQKYQITVGGPIIMVQVENEYDYSPPMPDADKREYVRALANMVWRAGIGVPVITCWTKQARDNSDPDMARIMDTCNFYPRWNITKEVVPKLQELRKQESSSPVAVTELQGGWFSKFGGKLSMDQDGANSAEQISTLTKTVLEHGVTYFNYYMAFGGTNFDWAAKDMTTTYDYAAPIREPGGLWDKYYSVRGITQFLGLHGDVLARALKLPDGAESTNANVSVTERVNGNSAVLFLRENGNAEQRYKVTFTDPHSPTKRKITVPREGELVIGPREMKMLAVGVSIPGSELRYSTAEVLAHGLNLDRHFLILYDAPGRKAEISLATLSEPQVEGDTLYRYWDSEDESVVLGVQFEKTEKVLLVNDHLLVILLPKTLALQTWVTEFPSKVVPEAEETKPFAVPIITDGYMFAGSGSQKSRIWFDLDLQPGEHEVTLLLPPTPDKCRVDDGRAGFAYDRGRRTARLRLTVPPLSCAPFDLGDGQFWIERFDGQNGWQTHASGALEDTGPVPYGYVKYKAQFNYNNEPKIFISAFSNDVTKVFVNGKLASGGVKPEKTVSLDLEKCAKVGTNILEIAYEAFGAANGGKDLGALKGIESVRLGADAERGAAVGSLQVQRFAAPMQGRGVDMGFAAAAWSPASWRVSNLPDELLPAFTWYRTEFVLPAVVAGWTVPWKLSFEAGRDALIYLNGKFVGRYVTMGPQKEFYLPKPYLAPPGSKNVLTFVLAYTDRPEHVRTLRIGPYVEFSARRSHVEFEW